MVRRRLLEWHQRRRAPSPDRLRAFENLSPSERSRIVLLGMATGVVLLPYYGVVVWLLLASGVRAWRLRSAGVGTAALDATSWRALLVLGVGGRAVWWAFEPLRDDVERMVQVAGERDSAPH